VLQTAPLRHGRIRAIVPANTPLPLRIDLDEGGIVKAAAANGILAGLLEDMIVSGATTIFIEDSALRRGDPALARADTPVAFLGDKVIRWCELRPGSGSAAVRAVRAGSSGYPLNAFVTGSSATSLGLVDGTAVPNGLASQVVNSLLAVVVSAFDAESFLVWDSAGRL